MAKLAILRFQMALVENTDHPVFDQRTRLFGAIPLFHQME